MGYIYKITDLTFMYFAIVMLKTRPQTVRQFWLHLLCLSYMKLLWCFATLLRLQILI
jgi:hypothetical protein